MSEMIERVARAIRAEIRGIPDDGSPVADDWADYVGRYTDVARAAVEAMREVPESMQRFEAASGELIDWNATCNYCSGHKFAYQAVIDEALK